MMALLWKEHDTIIFDGEGVVIASEPIWDAGQVEFLRRRGIAYDREKLKPLLTGRSLREGVQIMQAEFGFPGDPSALAAERLAIVRDAFRRDVGPGDFVPGFREFFEKIAPRFKTAVATMMTKELLDPVVEKLQLAALFGEHIYSPDAHDLPGKPEPDLFLFAARRLGSTPGRSVVIEDSPIGIEAAKRANMFAIGIATTFTRAKLAAADLVVDSFAGIPLPDPAG